MTTFYDPDEYKDMLCPACLKILRQVTSLFRSGDMPDTDDPEAPSMYMYDHRMYCGGHTCKDNQ